jgi:hypothetical protein
MSTERLQEHFSSLYEGTLDPGLAQQIQHRMENDSELKAEYARFCSMMSILGSMPEEEIEVPPFLSSRITERIDSELNKKKVFSLSSWLRPAMAVGAVTILFVGTMLAVKNQSPSTVQAGLMGAGSPTMPVLDEVNIQLRKGKSELRYQSSGPKSLKVYSYETKKMLKSFDVDGDLVMLTLENPQATAAAFEIVASGEVSKHYAVSPGSNSTVELKGKGNLVDFAKVLSTKFNKSVRIRTEKLGDFEWDVQEADFGAAAAKVLGASDFTISEGKDGMISILSRN